MDTESFLLARRDQQDRIERQRQQIAFERREQERAPKGSLFGPLVRWVLSQAPVRAPISQGLPGGALGWLASTLAPRLWGSFHKRSFL